MDYQFSDLVDIPDLQQILVSFHAASGITAEILDLETQITLLLRAKIPGTNSNSSHKVGRLAKNSCRKITENP